jgi:L-arabinokinase
MTPSYPIVFYVSGHGFGHSSRTIELIRALVERRPDAAITVKTSAPRRLFERAFGDLVPVSELECDTGLVQLDSLRIDVAESVARARAFHENLPRLAADEAAFLRQTGARLVVGDIPPLACAAATAAGVPAAVIGNFTWDWIYEEYAEHSPADLCRAIRSTYQAAALAMRLPLCGGFEGLGAVRMDIPFIARKSRREPDDVRRAIGLPPREGDKPLVLMSFGGYGLARLDGRELSRLSDYRIATTDLPARGSGANAINPAPGVLYLSEQKLHEEGYRYEDLVRAADVVVTKPGYGIVSESIANDAALLYTSRGRFAEYDLFVREMPRYLRTQFIDQSDLFSGNWAPPLEKLLSQPAPPENPRLDGASVAADALLARL